MPSSDKTNFDATYDLEELLLEEAPLEARARRQKPRERLKEDATDKEIREDELYRMIETDFRPFDYTHAAYKKYDPVKARRAPPVFFNANRGNRLTAAQEKLSDDGAPVEKVDMSIQPQALTTDEATLVVPTTGSNGAGTSHFQPESTHASQGGSPSSKDKSSRGSGTHQRRGPPGRPPPLPPYPQSYISPSNGARSGPAGGPSIIAQSPTGGVQVTLDGGGSWSDLARQDATLPADASGANNELGGKPEGSGGVFGFLSRKKGRGSSPKPKERGVLGKEGARVVIG